MTIPTTTPKATASEKRAGLLFDYCVLNGGFTVDVAGRDLGWSPSQTNLAIRALREDFATGSINLICEPAGTGRWHYRLVGDLEQAKPWITNRVNDMRTRIRTIGNIAKSMVQATDGRSLEGRRARLIAKTLEALEAQLDALDDLEPKP
jgi:hypothetical protein